MRQDFTIGWLAFCLFVVFSDLLPNIDVLILVIRVNERMIRMTFTILSVSSFKFLNLYSR